jgi:hypothetical protein
MYSPPLPEPAAGGKAPPPLPEPVEITAHIMINIRHAGNVSVPP